jgi:hypothetical protein
MVEQWLRGALEGANVRRERQNRIFQLRQCTPGCLHGALEWLSGTVEWLRGALEGPNVRFWRKNRVFRPCDGIAGRSHGTLG